MKSGEQVQSNDALEPLQVSGEILDNSAYDTLSVITDEDVERLPQTWGRVVPERYKFLISAEEIDNSR